MFFFFKQKTAYEIGVRLVGSEMCIRDSSLWRVRYGQDCFQLALSIFEKAIDLIPYLAQSTPGSIKTNSRIDDPLIVISHKPISSDLLRVAANTMTIQKQKNKQRSPKEQPILLLFCIAWRLATISCFDPMYLSLIHI
eukprot:TRINITY_DN8056_c0_g1_i3.p1 TRINITY_DN8056_c0_g1~~TRINITY_DN8056_c0_g1_i3.p1  ORF type:complete len:138 (-),score=14.96 TRINITY_DN8056_c0_g1_i3:61-474(-)